MIQVTPPNNSKNTKKTKKNNNNEVNIFAMKRKEGVEGNTSFSEQEKGRPSKKGKERENGAVKLKIKAGSKSIITWL
jgi:hypothetical protein